MDLSRPWPSGPNLSSSSNSLEYSCSEISSHEENKSEENLRKNNYSDEETGINHNSIHPFYYPKPEQFHTQEGFGLSSESEDYESENLQSAYLYKITGFNEQNQNLARTVRKRSPWSSKNWAVPTPRKILSGLEKTGKFKVDNFRNTQVVEMFEMPAENVSKKRKKKQPKFYKQEILGGEGHGNSFQGELLLGSQIEDVDKELTITCECWWVLTSSVPVVGILTMTLTVSVFCHSSTVSCLSSKGYPTLSFAAEYAPSGWIFAGGMLITSLLSLLTLAAFLLVCIENHNKVKIRPVMIQLCLILALISCGSLALLGCLNLAEHHFSHTMLSLLFFPASWICLFLVLSFRQAFQQKQDASKKSCCAFFWSLSDSALFSRSLGTGLTFVGFGFAVVFTVAYFDINHTSHLFLPASVEGISEQLSICSQLLVLGSLWPEIQLLNSRSLDLHEEQLDIDSDSLI